MAKLPLKTKAQAAKDLEKFFPAEVTASSDHPPHGHIEALYQGVMAALQPTDTSLLKWDKTPESISGAMDELVGRVAKVEAVVLKPGVQPSDLEAYDPATWAMPLPKCKHEAIARMAAVVFALNSNVKIP